MKNKSDFSFSYFAPTNEERAEIESIKNNYIEKRKEISKLDYLRKLDKKATLNPKILAIIVGIIGVLIFGSGLTMVLEWNIWLWGCVVGVIGVIIMSLAYFVYIFMSKIYKKLYSDEIIKISDELLNAK